MIAENQHISSVQFALTHEWSFLNTGTQAIHFNGGKPIPCPPFSDLNLDAFLCRIVDDMDKLCLSGLCRLFFYLIPRGIHFFQGTFLDILAHRCKRHLHLFKAFYKFIDGFVKHVLCVQF